VRTGAAVPPPFPLTWIPSIINGSLLLVDDSISLSPYFLIIISGQLVRTTIANDSCDALAAEARLAATTIMKRTGTDGKALVRPGETRGCVPRQAGRYYFVDKLYYFAILYAGDFSGASCPGRDGQRQEQNGIRSCRMSFMDPLMSEDP
jgi:hypothetical protein